MPSPATAFSNEMALLTGNAGGNIQALPRVSVVGGRKRSFFATITLASQAIATVIGVARLPKGAVLCGFCLHTDTSLGTSTIALGDVNTPALFTAAATLTTVDAPIWVGKTAAVGAPLDGPIYDAGTGQLSAAYEDVTLTVAAAALPANGTLKIETVYTID